MGQGRAGSDKYLSSGAFSEDKLKAAKKEILAEVKAAVKFADESPMPPMELAKELEFPDAPDTDYNLKPAPKFADEVNKRTISEDKTATIEAHIASLRAKAEAGEISIGNAINLAIHEEMLRDPTTTIHAEDLQAGSSYDIPKLTQQTYGQIRAAASSQARPRQPPCMTAPPVLWPCTAPPPSVHTQPLLPP